MEMEMEMTNGAFTIFRDKLIHMETGGILTIQYDLKELKIKNFANDLIISIR